MKSLKIFNSIIQNRIYLITLFFLFVLKQECAANFKIKIKITNCKENLKAYVFSDFKASHLPDIIDSASLNNGECTLNGPISIPTLLNIVFLTNYNVIPNLSPTICLFVENGEIEITADFNDIPTFTSLLENDYPYYNKIKIKGSQSQNLLQEFYSQMSDYQKQSTILSKWHSNYTNAARQNAKGSVYKSITTIHPIDSLESVITNYTKDFVKKHINNPISVFITNNFFHRFSINEINNILEMLESYQKDNGAFISLKTKIDTYNKSNIGANVLDYVLQDSSGRLVNLKEYVAKKKKYILLEFWASWCMPCRNDFPHLKVVYDLYGPCEFEILAISLDDKKGNWLKAIQEDGTTWAQLIDPKGLHGSLIRLYNFDSIPTSILLDRNGTIISRKVRGAWLDEKLIALFGNKFGDLY